MEKKSINLETLNDLSKDILLSLSAKGEIIYINRAGEEELFQAIKQTSIAEVFSATNSKLIMQYIQSCLENKQEYAFEIEERGQYYQAKMVYGSDQEVLVRMSNISEQWRLSQILSETRKRLNFASRIAKIGYWELDLIKRQVSWSDEMFRIFGLDPKSTNIRKNIIKKLMFAEDWKKYRGKIRNILKTGTPEEGMVRIKNQAGKTLYCRYLADYYNYDLYHRKIVGTFQDLTQLMEIQQALEFAKETAESLNKEKSVFFAQASHDLQQPMTALVLFIDNLLSEKLTAEQQILVGKIHDTTKVLRKLLLNLLDISRLDSGGMEAKPEKYTVNQIIKNLVFEFEPVVKSKKIELSEKLCRGYVVTDAFLLERILRNFMDNAVKYTKNKIEIGAKRTKENIIFYVKDNGIGISKEEQNLIFDEYYQSLKVKDNRKKGSGLGLSIVKKMANMLQAEVGVDSEENKGSCFYIKLKNLANF